MVPTLSSARTLVVLDAPSCGRSDPLTRATDIAACADAAAEIVTRVVADHDVNQVDWLGNAWGGHVGMHLAATRPDLVGSLISISAPTFPITSAMRRQIRALMPLYRIAGPRGPVLRAISAGLFTDETLAHDPETSTMLRSALHTSGRHMITATRTAILNRTDLGWATRQIVCPTLFVATEDRGEWTPAEAGVVADEMVDAHVGSVARARVIPAWEQPGVTADLILEFWRTHPPAATTARPGRPGESA
ncbi:alpha/beta fold hydrolase [Gordonia sp. NPDC003425]